MCEWGKTDIVSIPSLGGKGFKKVDVDSCIYQIVKALNMSGIETVASCCGHDNNFGIISLKDGRELIISPNFELSRKVDELIDKEGLRDE